MRSPIDDDTLQRYYDGDLSPLEEHSVQARIESDPDAQARLEKLSRLSDLLQSNAEEIARELDSSALFAGIEQRIAVQEKLGFGARLRVLSTEWVEHKRSTLLPIVAATAVAAATLLMVTRTDPASAPPVDTAVAVHGTSVENVDFGSNTGTVFAVDNRGVAVAVVWISEDEEEP